jgi:hypothetical protein
MIDFSIVGDIELLQKYKDGRIIDTCDLQEIRRLVNIGFMTKVGVILDGKKRTTRTSPVGLKILFDSINQKENYIKYYT